MARDVTSVRQDFPYFNQKDTDRAYLDSAATTQKPGAVIDAVSDFYATKNANIHRGVYATASGATESYEQVRDRVKNFINAPERESIVFTKNATEALNLVAFGWARRILKAGDEIIVTSLEHHANLLPWREVAKEVGAVVRVVPLTKDLELDVEVFEAMLSEKTRVVSISALSNVLGVTTPLSIVIEKSHKYNAKVVVDAAQYGAHLPIDVTGLDVDFLALSAHKMLGPMGAGVLYAKKSHHNEMMPLLYGGGMVSEISDDSCVYQDMPYRLEAGTPDVSAVIGFGAALKYLDDLGFDWIASHDAEIRDYAVDQLSKVEEVVLLMPKDLSRHVGVLSFIVKGIHAHDIASVLDQSGVAVRAGNHCAQPLMQALGINGAVRVSWCVYTSRDDIDQLISGVRAAIALFARK